MNERKLLIDTDTRHTTSSGLQHSESFTSLAPFVGTIKIEHFSFLWWLVNFDSHCMCAQYITFHSSVDSGSSDMDLKSTKNHSNLRVKATDITNC